MNGHQASMYDHQMDAADQGINPPITNHPITEDIQFLDDARYALVVTKRRHRRYPTFLPGAFKTIIHDEMFKWMQANNLARILTEDPMVECVEIVIRMRRYLSPSQVNGKVVRTMVGRAI